MGSEIKTLGEALECIESMKGVQDRLHKRVADRTSELEDVRADIRKAAGAARDLGAVKFSCESVAGTKAFIRCRDILDALVESDPLERQAKKDAKFRAHLKECSAIVAGWPEWKRRACSWALTDAERLQRRGQGWEPS